MQCSWMCRSTVQPTNRPPGQIAYMQMLYASSVVVLTPSFCARRLCPEGMKACCWRAMQVQLLQSAAVSAKVVGLRCASLSSQLSASGVNTVHLLVVAPPHPPRV